METDLTLDEMQVAYDLFIARQLGLAGAVKPEYLPEAHNLCERGWLSRRIEDDDVIFEFTDAGLVALNLGAQISNN
jgi:hypothetical protein